jgi:hypothetical protein
MRAVARAFSLARVQSREGPNRAPDQARKRGSGTFAPVLALVIFGDGVATRSEVGRSEMSLPDPDDDMKHNVVRLGTETLFAIAEQLRRMYDADLRTKPSEKLERLMRRGRSLGERRPPHQQQVISRSSRHVLRILGFGRKAWETSEQGAGCARVP